MKHVFAQRVISSLLAFWLSGIVLLFCCGKTAARDEAEAADSCPLAKTSHCGKAARDEAEIAAFKIQPPHRAAACCDFLPQVFDKARKFDKFETAAPRAETAAAGAPRISFAVQPKAPPPRVYQSFVRNRGGTYLKNRAFRI